MAHNRRFVSYARTEEVQTLYAYVPLQASTSAGFAKLAITGSGFQGLYLSGNTYTVVMNEAYPQVAGLDAILLTSKNFAGTTTGSLVANFNPAQISQLTRFFSGSSVQPTGSGASQTIDFTINYGSGVSAPLIPAGSGSVFLQFTFLNQDRTKL